MAEFDPDKAVARVRELQTLFNEKGLLCHNQNAIHEYVETMDALMLHLDNGGSLPDCWEKCAAMHNERDE